MLAATDFFTVEVLTLKGLATYYVLFSFIWRTRRSEKAGGPPFEAMTPGGPMAFGRHIASLSLRT